jgi:phosphoenolpyruvate carboxylase
MARSAMNSAQRAEPRGIGGGRSRDPLGREVKLLGSLLGQVIAEQEGVEKLELVERIRRRAIELRRAQDEGGREALAEELADLPASDQAILVRAFGLYFGLINLAERRHRGRILARRARVARTRPVRGSLAEAVAAVEGEVGADATRTLVDRLSVTPVLTAHPTEARRRTILVALGRCARLVERLDDPRLTADGDRDLRRRLREEITILWRTAELRSVSPAPLDEVRTAMVVFDEVLFTTIPRLYRALGAALPGTGSEATTREPSPAAFLRLGSWVGGDRDGHPAVTAEVTRQAVRIGADHVLRGYEAVCSRLMQTISATVPDDRVDDRLAARLADDRAILGPTMRMLERRFPHEPYRRRLGAMAERLRRTRAVLVDRADHAPGAYATADAFAGELAELADALTADRLERIVNGELADLRWQLDTFGFHLASLEVRQHADIHREALARLDVGSDPDAALVGASGVSAAEVLETFRAIGDIQGRFGEAACHRYVVSFTEQPADVVGVLDLARRAGVSARLDVVPLLESADALARAGPFLDALFADAAYRAHLASRPGQEVMLGYSDSNMESGFLAASWSLHRAQRALVDAARRAAVRLTIFHGRGGAIGRGGGPMEEAILGMGPGAVDGRLKMTEQGEVVAARYGDPTIALRELEQMTGATLLASTPQRDATAAAWMDRGGPTMEDLATRARAAYRSLVWDDPGFAAFFEAVTPIGEIATMRLGSRPASRRGQGDAGRQPTLVGLRAIPWVFAWSQARIALPGWYGIGTALDGFGAASGRTGWSELRRMYRSWPFFRSTLDNAELALARTDIGIGREYARLAGDGAADRRWQMIEAEHSLAVASILRLTGRSVLLEDRPVIRRAIALRTPYVDPLSLLQARLLGRLSATGGGDRSPADRERDRRLVHLTINGVAAGILTTG